MFPFCLMQRFLVSFNVVKGCGRGISFVPSSFHSTEEALNRALIALANQGSITRISGSLWEERVYSSISYFLC